MPALFFPNLDALRLVLASGLVPLEVTGAPARAGFDPHGRLWLEPASLPRREALAGLARFGVQALAAGGAPTEAVSAWADLLPLRRVRSTHILSGGSRRTLLELPDTHLARVVRELTRRGCHPLGVRLLTADGPGRAWVTCSGPPPLDLLLKYAEPDSLVEPFVEQVSGAWARVGWEHPLPDHLVVPAGRVLLLRPPRAIATRPGPVPTPTAHDYPVRGPTSPNPPLGVAPRVPVRLTLKPLAESPREALWVFGEASVESFWEFCRSGDERIVRLIEVATGGLGGKAGVVVRPRPGKRVPPIGGFPDAAYSPDPRVPGLFLPTGRSLQPVIRAKELAALLGIASDRVTWVDTGPDGEVVSQSVPVASFRPVSEGLNYEVPPPVYLVATQPRSEAFPFHPVCASPGVDSPQPGEIPILSLAEVEPEPTAQPDEPGWLTRSLERIAGHFMRSPRGRVESEGPERSRPTPVRAPSRRPTPERVEEKLASPDALLHGQERAAHRDELEARLLVEFPRLGPDQRAAGWAELAAVYATTGNPADAAISWINAVWEASSAPVGWLEQWYVAECRAAKQPAADPALDRWLGEPGRLGNARVIAAYTTWAGQQATPPTDLLAALPRVLAILDQQFDDLPARAVWLARVAASRVSDGDTLGLARCRDRVLARLREKGPGLDLDEPSFLRFHGTSSPDRFQTARLWLSRARKPILDWIGRLGPTGRLQWAGLDVETTSTAAYAQLMLAWGLGCLGERARSRDWAARSRKFLTRTTGPGVDSSAHEVLADAFQSRIRDAQEGRAARPGLPPELAARVERLSSFSRYAVDRLRDHCRILDPVGRVRAFRGLDLRGFRGHDLLGERLQVFADRADSTTLADEARELLAICTEEPSSETVPRVVMTLLDSAAYLDATIVRAILPHAVPACSWMETWLQNGRWTDAERAERLPGYLGRLIAGALAAAAAFNLLPEIRGLVEYLARRAASDPSVRTGVIGIAGSLFRSLRKLGYREEAEALLPSLDPGRGDWPEASPFPASRLGLAVGWFAVGDEDAGNRILDDARRRLFVSRVGDERERTELVIAYADALGFAPPRIALGRLEEIFQLLDGVTVGGSTNRYYTLKPLQLIDAVVRAVVTDEFALGPAVRGWLDDDEFLIRRRIHRDMAEALREEGLSLER